MRIEGLGFRALWFLIKFSLFEAFSVAGPPFQGWRGERKVVWRLVGDGRGVERRLLVVTRSVDLRVFWT